MRYTVSVRLMTFNHRAFIREAIESILRQKTDFNVEIVVGDDYSNDGTLDIIKEYKSTENIHIRILERRIGDEYWKKRQNLGRLYNFVNILENCSGEYVALLDGDDYWIDELKLQKQVEFLRANADFILTSGNSKVIYEEATNKIEYFRPNWTKCLTNVIAVEDQIRYAPAFHISSVLFRNEILDEIPDFFYDTISGDIVLFTIMCSKGKLSYVDDIFSCYRVNKSGITKSYLGYKRLRYKYERKILMYKSLNSYFEFKYNHLFKSFIWSYTRRLVQTPRKFKDYFSFFLYTLRNLNQPIFFVLYIEWLVTKFLLKIKSFN
ncbi:MAG: glycosyltransferase [Cyclobacteriaceae bacterium]